MTWPQAQHKKTHKQNGFATIAVVEDFDHKRFEKVVQPTPFHSVAAQAKLSLARQERQFHLTLFISLDSGAQFYPVLAKCGSRYPKIMAIPRRHAVSPHFVHVTKPV